MGGVEGRASRDESGGRPIPQGGTSLRLATETDGSDALPLRSDSETGRSTLDRSTLDSGRWELVGDFFEGVG
jgi:hypothetical protein